MQTFYWHDYETWGAVPSVDRASQFAGVRTDVNLNIIEEPLVIYCKPPVDLWPNPEACLITGITPQEADEKGLNEKEFIARIHRELAQPGTCGVGYNSLRFDDEITRYTLFRNFYDPYEREWRNGNSRWDIIDMVRLVYALRPDDIEWPMVDGKPSFKLENLTAANGISHQSAHDAYSDVEATIEIAKLIKRQKPLLYDYVWKNKGKREAARFIDIENCKPLLHVSSRFPSGKGCAGLIVPLAMHPKNKNAVIVYELSVDPSPLADLSAEDIKNRVFCSQKDLPEGTLRLPIKLVHLNKCPILATPKLLEDAAAQRLGIDKSQCEVHWRMLKTMNSMDEIGIKLRAMYELDSFERPTDPEQRLYDGFLGDHDKRLMTELRRLSGEEFSSRNFAFEDERLREMVFRYKARNFSESLSHSELEQWREFVLERLQYGSPDTLSFEALIQKINGLKDENADHKSRLSILDALYQYANRRMDEVLGL